MEHTAWSSCMRTDLYSHSCNANAPNNPNLQHISLGFKTHLGRIEEVSLWTLLIAALWMVDFPCQIQYDIMRPAHALIGLFQTLSLSVNTCVFPVLAS